MAALCWTFIGLTVLCYAYAGYIILCAIVLMFNKLHCRSITYVPIEFCAAVMSFPTVQVYVMLRA